MVIKGAETEQKNENGMKTSYKFNVMMIKIIGDWIVLSVTMNGCLSRCVDLGVPGEFF